MKYIIGILLLILLSSCSPIQEQKEEVSDYILIHCSPTTEWVVYKSKKTEELLCIPKNSESGTPITIKSNEEDTQILQ